MGASTTAAPASLSSPASVGVGSDGTVAAEAVVLMSMVSLLPLLLTISRTLGDGARPPADPCASPPADPSCATPFSGACASRAALPMRRQLRSVSTREGPSMGMSAALAASMPSAPGMGMSAAVAASMLSAPSCCRYALAQSLRNMEAE